MDYKLLFESPEKFKDMREVETLFFLCMDARFEEHSNLFKKFLGRKGYDRHIVAGGIIGLFAEEYGLPSPRNFYLFTENFAEKYHHIKEVILVEHDDCGAYKSALANKLKKDRASVTPEEIKNEQEINLQRAKQCFLRINPRLAILMVRACLEEGKVRFYEVR